MEGMAILIGGHSVFSLEEAAEIIDVLKAAFFCYLLNIQG
jgi:hypothetical protein